MKKKGKKEVALRKVCSCPASYQVFGERGEKGFGKGGKGSEITL